MIQRLRKTQVCVDIETTALNIDTSETKSAKLHLKYSKLLNYPFGTGAGQANQIWEHRGTIGGGLQDRWNLRSAPGVADNVTDPFGDTLSFSRVRVMLIANTSTIADTCMIAVGPDIGGTAWSNWMGAGAELVLIHPGGIVLLAVTTADAYEITNLAHDIQIVNADAINDSTYDIVILGISA